ncbi:MAG: DUF5979 domain-containing protein, partial [Erysipelotrichaceae bacterium]|nr:DUF5979 domain-containing protein [Erysipelotrichaceae bacterium]
EGNIIENPWYGTGPVLFDVIEVDETSIGKRLEYRITEYIENDDGTVVYDTHEEFVSVTVNDNGAGVLQADVIYDSDGTLFTNIQNPGSLKISKFVEDAPEGDESVFAFTLTLMDEEGNELEGEYEASIFEGDEAVETLKVSSGTSFELKGGQYLLVEGLPDGTTYEVTEEDAENWTLTESSNTEGKIVSAETAEAGFTNRYEPEVIEPEGTVVLKARKEFEGDIITEENDFLFQLLDQDGEVIETKGPDETDVEASDITFAELYYDKDDAGKTFTYYIKEVDGEDPGIEYSAVRYVVEVDVIDNGTKLYDFDIRYYKLGEDEALGEDETATFVNIRKYPFTLIKKAADTGEALSSAAFVVKKGDLFVQPDGSLSEDEYVFVTGGDGTFRIECLVPGEYVAKECNAPKGYDKAEDVTFTVTDGDVELEIEDPKKPDTSDKPSYTIPFTGV